MLRLHAERFVRVYRTLGSMHNFLIRNNVDDIDDDVYQWLTNLAYSLSSQISKMNLSMSARMADTFLQHCKEKYSPQTLSSELHHLFRTIELELRPVVFVQIPTDRHGYYDLLQSRLDENVLQKLPSIVSDLEEGSKCFALGRPTACVFHMMRVMEICVQKLGKRFKVKLAQEKNWQVILDQINKAIKNMHPKTIRGKNRLSEYAAIAAHLYSVKAAWRNSVIHPKASYTDEEAEEVLRHVIIFVNHLAVTLK
jgi:hypothetical protein